MKHKLSLLSIGMAVIMLVSLCAVVSSTSVSAAPSSSTNLTVSQMLVKSPPPMGVRGDPAVCSYPWTYRIDVFVRGTDDAIWYVHQDKGTGVWSGWTSLGGRVASSPAAASSDANTIIVAAAGADYPYPLYRIASTTGGASWSSWEYRGGAIHQGTGPAVVTKPDSTIYFVIGRTNNQLYMWTGGTSWKALGGYATSSPSAAKWVIGATDGITVAVRGRLDGVYTLDSYDWGANWNPAWQNLGGRTVLGTGPAVVNSNYLAANRYYYCVGTNHQLYWYHGGTWVTLGGYLTSSAAATCWIPGDMHLIARGAGDQHLWSKYTLDGGGSWWGWTETPQH